MSEKNSFEYATNKEDLLKALAIGDGHIRKNGSLQLRHSVGQESYFYYKISLLDFFKIKYGRISVGDARPTYLVKNPKETLNVCTTSKIFLIKSLRRYFYPCGTKIIPDDLFITPFMWSIIYQDDGRANKLSHYNQRDGTRVDVPPFVNRYTLYVDSLDEKSIFNLQHSLLFYGIESSVNYSNTAGHPHIHISRKESKTNFKNLIFDFIHPSMKYKIDFPVARQE